MDTAESGAGSDYIDTGMATSVLAKIRDAQSLLSKLPTPLSMPTATWTLPTE